MRCIRCDVEFVKGDKICVNEQKDLAHDECLGWDDLDEKWEEFHGV